MKTALISKLGLGTVQFGLDYGIHNATGQVPESGVKEILDIAKAEGITCLDTASLYGESERVLGRFLRTGQYDFQLVSKTKTLDVYTDGEIRKNVENSLELLSLKSISGYLIHHFKDYQAYPQIWEDLRELKQEGSIEKIGFSLYLPQEVDILLESNVDFDLLQVPYSVFDRRFEPYFERLKKQGTEIHTRSVFLQGLAFMKTEELSEKLKKASGPLGVLQRVSETIGLSILEICLNFALMNSFVDKVIVGVDSAQQLKENLSALDKSARLPEIMPALQDVRVDDETILLPYNWSA